MAQHLAIFLSANRRSILIVIALVFIIQSIMAFGIIKNTSPYFIGLEHEVRQDEVRSKDVFTRAGDTVLVLLKFQDTTVFDNKVVQLTQAISSDLEQLDILELIDGKKLSNFSNRSLEETRQSLSTNESAINFYNYLQKTMSLVELNEVFGEYIFPVKSVKSLINTDNIYAQDDEIFVESSYFEQADNQWTPQVKALILENLLLTGSFVSEAGDSLAIHVELNINEEHASANKLAINKIKTIINGHINRINKDITATVHYAGVPIVNSAMSEVMEKDNALYFPFVILFVLILLVISFRSVLAAVYGLVIAIVSIVITMGFMPVLGITLNIMTTVLPIFIITIAVTDAIHVLSDVGAPSILSNEERIHKSIEKLFRPMLITSITTAIGFFSLAITEITNVRSFGIMVGISVIVAFILSVTLLPLLLVARPIKSFSANTKSQVFSKSVSHLLTKLNWFSFCVVVFTAIISLVGINMLHVDQASIQSFDAETQVRVDNAVINQQGVGSIPVGIWFSSKEQEGVLSPEVLNTLLAVDTFLSEHESVVDSVSILDFLDQMHKTLNDDDSVLDLNNSGLIRQYLFLLEGSAERDLESLINVGPYSETRIVVSMKDDSSATIDNLMQELDQVIIPMLPTDVERIYTGYGAITVAAAYEVLKSQMISMTVSLVLILLIVSLVFRSFLTGLVSMIPLCMTLATMFGIMGMFGFSIDIGSSVIASIAFGIGIDYSIHFVEAVRRTYEPEDPLSGIEKTLRQVFMPIFVSAVVISSGFSLLLLSSFKPIANLGLLITVAMLMSATFSLVILPKLLLIRSGFLYHIIAVEKHS